MRPCGRKSTGDSALYRAFGKCLTLDSLPCSARIGVQADAVRSARDPVSEYPASRPTPLPEVEESVQG
jgi:hypothetical protein